MPVGKYYCDYCEKQFKDNPIARKRHIQGVQHQRAKALWFSSLNHPTQSYTHGFTKGVCNRFVNTGFCQYGDTCKYIHPSQNLNTQGAIQPPTIHGDHFVGGSSLPGNLVRDRMGVSWNNLPPSLQPPPESGYPPLPFVDWG